MFSCGWGPIAPSLASLSTSLFPRVPLWPLVHLMKVLALLHLIQAMILLKRLPLVMSIQPLCSHLFRFLVSLSMTYLESLISLRSSAGSWFFTASRTTMSSPVWLDCVARGMHALMFHGSFSPYHTPAQAFAVPFSRHVPPM